MSMSIWLASDATVSADVSELVGSANTLNLGSSNAFSIMRALGHELDAETGAGSIPVSALTAIIDSLGRAHPAMRGAMYAHADASRMLQLFDRALANNEPVFYG